MNSKNNELLIKGLSILKELEFSHIPQESEIDYEFSEEYIRNKEKLLNKIGRSYWKYINTVAKKVAIITISIIIACSSLLTVDSIRERFVNFIVNIYNTLSEVKLEESYETDHIDKYYSIAKLPRHYTKVASNYSYAIGYVSWSSLKYGNISLIQTPKNSINIFNSEHGELYETTINNTACLICKDLIFYYCYWEFDSYRFELVYPIELGEEFMSEVVGRLVEVDPEELMTE